MIESGWGCKKNCSPEDRIDIEFTSDEAAAEAYAKMCGHYSPQLGLSDFIPTNRRSNILSLMGDR